MAIASLPNNARQIIPVRPIGLTSIPTFDAPEGASVTSVRGAPLIDSGGYLIAASADPTGVIGFATGAGSGDTAAGTSRIGYTPALPSIIFEGTLEDQTNGDTTSHVLVVTNRFVRFALQVDDDGIWYLDENDSGTDVRHCAFVIDWDPDQLGASGARVHFVMTGGGTGAWLYRAN